jgi:hypothetical protein
VWDVPWDSGGVPAPNGIPDVQTPIDVEIMTAGNRRVDRVQIEAKEEQDLKFVVDSEPLLVNFDNEGTLIKELMFVKTTGQLIYQLQNDRDPLGRIWASSQLSLRMGRKVAG